MIDGRTVFAASGATFECRSPRDGRLLAEVAACGAEDVDRAVSSARKAFEGGSWSRRPPVERKRVLLRLSELLLACREELALLETLDTGKPITESLEADVPGAAGVLAWYAETADKVYDHVAPTAEDTLAVVTREPIGVVAAIIPWNFPLCIAAWKLGPALSRGNSVVLKPSERAPLTAIRLGELALEAGLPEGVLQIVPGYGQEAGLALAVHPDVDCVAFTGSGATGKAILACAGQTNMKRVYLECGGKSANIVAGDAPDLDRAARTAAAAAFYNQGEMCSAGSRLLVHDSVRDALLDKLLPLAAAWAPGDPLDTATRMGALIDAPHLARVGGYVEVGRSAGARLLLGGRRPKPVAGGHYHEPTVFDSVEPDMAIARDEIFGPVLSVMTFAELDDAIRIANSTEYGLAAAVWTGGLATAAGIARRLRAGTVYVNTYDVDDVTVPFGGYKQSGIGRDKSLLAIDQYTEWKTTWMSINSRT